jgi:hypothetical protein
MPEALKHGNLAPAARNNALADRRPGNLFNDVNLC